MFKKFGQGTRNKAIQGQGIELELTSEVIENFKHNLSECKEKIKKVSEICKKNDSKI